MAWRQLILRLNSAALTRAEALLELAGAQAIAIVDGADDPLFEPAPGQTPVWPEVELRALFSNEAELDNIAALLTTALGSKISIQSLADADWQDAWQQPVPARQFGTRLELLPAAGVAASSQRRSVRLHMGLAFGTGEHPTTALCLEWLDAEVATGDLILDYGCGSGVLALAALQLGASFAWAVDNDPQALRATRDNAELNGIDSLWVGSPDEFAGANVNLIAANILAGPLQTRAKAFADQLLTGGRIVLSGILEPQSDLIERAYEPYFENFDYAVTNGWMRIAATLKSAHDR